VSKKQTEANRARIARTRADRADTLDGSTLQVAAASPPLLSRLLSRVS
jgi:hypothetical protein